jgi:hypothetical protein
MGADHIIDYPCEVKRTLGKGDVAQGTVQLLRLLKLRAVLEVARQNGKDEVTRVVMLPTGPKEERLGRRELEAAQAPLRELEATCAGCPAACGKQAFGCIGHVRYPVSAEGERWLADRLPGPDELRGAFLRKAIADFRYTGAPLEPWRARGLLALGQPLRRGDVDTNQLLQALFVTGPSLNPHHCFLLVFWLGLVRHQKQPIDSPDALAEVIELPPARRAEAVAVKLGRAETPGEVDVQQLVRALFRAWLLDVPLLVDA